MGILSLLIFLVLFGLLLFGLLSVAEGRSGSLATTASRSRRRSNRAQRSAPRGNTAAQRAMQRAGYEGGGNYVEVTDIGLLAYRQSDEPKMIRYGDVLVDTHFLRPFIELWLPYQARGTVRFELLDNTERVRYVDEADYDLEPGDNVLLPSTWLPLRGGTIPPGEWRLQVMAGDTLLARHPFGWQQVGGGELQPYIASDGEISPALQHALRAHARQAVSLSDLLSDQEE
jgi:hypothetical protein